MRNHRHRLGMIVWLASISTKNRRRLQCMSLSPVLVATTRNCRRLRMIVWRGLISKKNHRRRRFVWQESVSTRSRRRRHGDDGDITVTL